MRYNEAYFITTLFGPILSDCDDPRNNCRISPVSGWVMPCTLFSCALYVKSWRQYNKTYLSIYEDIKLSLTPQNTSVKYLFITPQGLTIAQICKKQNQREIQCAHLEAIKHCQFQMLLTLTFDLG